jgi:hypothetical protein
MGVNRLPKPIISERVTFGDPIVLRRARVWTPTVEHPSIRRGRLGTIGQRAPGSPAHGGAGRLAVCSHRGPRRSQRLEGASVGSLSAVSVKSPEPALLGREPSLAEPWYSGILLHLTGRGRFRRAVARRGMLEGRHEDRSSYCGRPRLCPTPGFDLLSPVVGCPKERRTRSYVWSSGQGPHRLRRK